MIYTYIYAFLVLGWLVFIAVALIAYVIGLIFDNDFMMSVGFTATVLMVVCGVGYCIFELPSDCLLTYSMYLFKYFCSIFRTLFCK